MSSEPDKDVGVSGSDNINEGFAKDPNFVGPVESLRPLNEDNGISSRNDEVGSHNVELDVEKLKDGVEMGCKTVGGLGKDSVELVKTIDGNVGVMGSDNVHEGSAKDGNVVGPGESLRPINDDNVISSQNDEVGSHNVVEMGCTTVGDLGKDSVELVKTVDGNVGEDSNEAEVVVKDKEVVSEGGERFSDPKEADRVDDLGKDSVEAVKPVDDNVGKGSNETEVVMSDKEVVSEGGERFPDPIEADRVVDLGVKKDKKGRKKKGRFCVNDLVWGKVRSHPWWPGQIFEPDDASDEAKKRFRSKSHLVAYFWDHTYAWNEEVTLRPFLPHFSKMVKQTNKESFRHAVDCVLDEVSRRVEFGLSCRCIKDDVYNELKTQVIDNAGIREFSTKDECGDRFLTVSSFEPVKFLDYVKSLAQQPHIEVDRLEYVMTKGQISAFYRWKGCYHLAEFSYMIGYLSNEADSKKPTVEKDATCEKSDGKMVSSRRKKEEHITQTSKRKNVSGDSSHSSKKVKRVLDFVEKDSKKEKNRSEIVRKMVNMSSSYSPKRKATGTLIDDSTTEDCSPQSPVTEINSRDSKRLFSVGASILKVASQLSQPSPLLKVGVSSPAKATEAKGGDKIYQRKAKREPAEDPPNETLAEFLKAASNGKSKGKANNSEIMTTPEYGDLDVAAQKTMSNDENESSGDGDGDGDFAVLMETEDAHTVSESAASDSSQGDEKSQEDESPTALTLKFTDMDSIPSEADLNKIFCQFGPLKESETEVLKKKNCARVVFKRRVDADSAFSSSGKFETFGPSLVCYQLNYAPSPRKSPSVGAKQRKKDESPEEGNVA